MKHSKLWLVAAVALAAPFAAHAQATGQATAKATDVTCKDGTMSKKGRGACSKHGGVAPAGTAAASKAAAAPTSPPKSPMATAKAAPPASPPPAKAAVAAATPKSDKGDAKATAKCKDGTMSYAKQHSGACSKHGGVAQWLDGTK
jgi:hypothetical protein